MKEFVETASHLYQYLPSSENDNKWGMSITGSGRQTIKAYENYPPEHPSLYALSWQKGRKLNEIQCIYILNGKGVLETQDQNYEVNPGDMILIRPQEWHRYRPVLEIGWDERWVGIQGTYINHLLKEECIPFGLNLLHIGIHSDIIQLYDSIENLLKNRPPMAQQMASSATLLILNKALSAHTYNLNKQGNEMMNKAVLAMIQNAEHDLDMMNLSKQLHLSYDQFRHQFKTHTGISPKQYHLQLKIQRACELLLQTDMTIQEIALKLHFESQFYFSKIFKKRMGKSPLQWRKEN